MDSEILKELKTTCEGWRDTVEGLTEGSLIWCEECGDFSPVKGGRCENCCGLLDDGDEFATLWDLDAKVKILDITYRVGQNKKFLNGEICVGSGGPSIYIDTHEEAVCGYWGGDTYKACLSKSAVEAVNEMLEELYNN